MKLFMRNSFRTHFILFICILHQNYAESKPCAAREIPGKSVVCVCNETYCDDVIRVQPASGQYIAYTSSQAGFRFEKTEGNFRTCAPANVSLSLELHPKTLYQAIEGFGGAVTDAAGINWRNLSDILQKHLIDSYFSDRGLQYNMLRVPIGGCDFSTHPYAYNEQPENDTLLTNYTLAYEDYQYKIPMIKAAMEASSQPVHIVATTWSPPPWMKTNDQYSGYSHIKPEYFQTFADYHYKFVKKYAEKKIPIWGITTTNEPIDSGLTIVRFNDLGWSPDDMGKWIENNLGPTIRNSTFKDLKIITVDDQRYTIPYWFNVMIDQHPKALEYIDGVGIHFYGDVFAPPYFLQLVSDSHPEKFILGTEASEGAFPWEEKVSLGTWERASHYVLDILTDLNYNVVGWLDWNLCLDKKGGPNWASNFVDSPIIVYPEKKEFIKQPMFYAMGHFSKFVPRGSRRIKVTEDKQLFTLSADNVAFLTPYNTIVVVLYNNHDNNRRISIKLGRKQALFTLAAHSVVTAEFQYEN